MSMRSTTRHGFRLAAVAVALGATVILAGCGDGVNGAAPTTSAPGPTTSPTTTQPPTTASSSPEQTGTTVTATLTEFAINLSAQSFPAGRYTFVAEQAGQLPHALSISGPGVAEQTTPVIQPGGASESLAVTLQPGSYQLWCPIGSHRQQGMETTITVQ